MIHNNAELRGHIDYIQSCVKKCSDAELEKLLVNVVARDTAWDVSMVMTGKFCHGCAVLPQLIPPHLSSSDHQFASVVSNYVKKINNFSPTQMEGADDVGFEPHSMSFKEKFEFTRNVIAYLAIHIAFFPTVEISIVPSFWDQVDALLSTEA